MREDLSFLTSIDEYEKPDVQGTNVEAGRAKGGGDVVQLTRGKRRGKLGLALQGGGFS